MPGSSRPRRGGIATWPSAAIVIRFIYIGFLDDTTSHAPPTVRAFQPCLVRFSPSNATQTCLSGSWRGDHQRASNDFDERVARNPFDSHACAGGSLAGAEIGPVDFVQCVVLSLMSVESRLAGRHRNIISVRQADENV